MRFVGAFTDILIGSVIDRTNTRMGKFRPHIMVFCVPLVLSAVLAFSPAGLRGTNGGLIWAVVTCFLLGSVFYTLVNIPYGSLAAAMTGNSQDRSKFALARTIGTGIMQIVTAVAISPAIQQFAGDPDGLQATLTRTIALLVITSRANVERRIAEVGLKESLQTLAANRALQTLAGISVVYLAGLFCVTGILIYYARDALAFVGEALGDWAGLWLIGQFGCVSGAAAQPDPAITGITLAAGVAPAAFFLLAAILVQSYPLTDQRPAEILLDLRTRKDTGILPTAARQEMEAAHGAAGASPAAAPSSADGADGPQYDGGSSSAPDDQGPAAR